MNISKEKLNEIIALHVKWLRGEKGGKRADLRGADLSCADLRGAYLRGADLSCAYLSGANLKGADLSCANLSCAILSCADLSCAYLRGADLSCADLSCADLRGAYLSNADLRGADLDGAFLDGAFLDGAFLDKTYYQITRIGSRKGTTTYCVEDDKVTCGCWNSFKGGTLKEFKARVKSVYGSTGKTPHEQYYAEYMAAIAFFKSIKKKA